jgi:hypothetical protein
MPVVQSPPMVRKSKAHYSGDRHVAPRLAMTGVGAMSGSFRQKFCVSGAGEWLKTNTNPPVVDFCPWDLRILVDLYPEKW